jgi:hypothetical protein
MSLGPAIRLKSVLFKESVRLPGSGSNAHFIPTDDYPLVYYPELHLVEARLRPGIKPMEGQEAVRWYDKGNTRDMTPHPVELAPQPNLREEGGLLVAPTAQIRQLPGGGFERVTSEEAEPPVEPEPARPRAQPKAKPLKKAKAAAAPAPQPAPPATTMPAHPPNLARVKAERGD